MSDDYVREKLYVTMDCLAASAAPIQSRLESAAISALLRLNPDDFKDPEDRERFERIMAALTAAEPRGDEGTLVASTAAMDDEGAVAVASDLVELHHSFFPLTRGG